MINRFRALACAALFLLISLNSISGAMVPPFSLPVGTVVIDAGHGGSDPGAVAQDMHLQEKEITLDLALRVEAMLRQSAPELQLLLTRADDTYVALAERAAVAAQHNPSVGKQAIFLSIHVNSSPTVDASGFEILVKRTDKRVSFLDPSVEDWVLLRYANHTVGELNRLLNRENMVFASHMDRSIRNRFPEARARGIKEQDVWVLNASKVPSVLIEVAFISHRGDVDLMKQQRWREHMARAITDGVLSYINRD